MADLRKQLTESDARRQKEAEAAQNEIKELQLKNMYDYPISYQLQFLGPGKRVWKSNQNVLKS